MSRVRRSFRVAGLVCLACAGASWLILRTSPELALRSDLEVPPWLVLCGVGLLVFFSVAFLASLLPRRPARIAIQIAASACLGAMGLATVYPPFLGRCLSWWRGHYFRGLEYDDRGLTVRSWDGEDWILWPQDGRVIAFRPGPARYGEIYGQLPPARELDLRRLRSGVPLEVLESRSPVCTVNRATSIPGLITNDGKKFAPSLTTVEFWRVRDATMLFEAPSGHVTSVPGGSLVLLQTPVFESVGHPWLPRVTYVERLLPGLPPPPDRGRELLRMYDGEGEGEVWRRTLPSGSCRPSPKGTYLAAGDELLDCRTGKTLGFLGGGPRFWSPDEKWAIVQVPGGQLQAVRLPGGAAGGPARDLSMNRCCFRPDGAQIAVTCGDRVKLYSFPGLELQAETVLVYPDWLLCRASIVGSSAGLLALLVALLLPCARPTERVAEVPRSGSALGRTYVFFYLLLSPAAVLLAGILPLRLSEGLGEISYLATAALAVPAAFGCFCRRRLRLAAVLLTAPVLALLATLFLSTKVLGESPCASFRLLDRESIMDVATGKVREIRDGRTRVTLERLGIGNWFTYEKSGSAVRGRRGCLIAEWSLEDGALLRAAIEPPRNFQFQRDWVWYSCAREAAGRTLPLGMISDLGELHDALEMPDGGILFTKNSNLRVFESRISKVRYLEIPLHAALGSLILTLLIHGMARLVLARARPAR